MDALKPLFLALVAVASAAVVAYQIFPRREATFRTLSVVWVAGLVLMYWYLFSYKTSWVFLWPLAVSWAAAVAFLHFRPEDMRRVNVPWNVNAFEVATLAGALLVKDIPWGHALGILALLLLASGWVIRKRTETRQAAREARRKRWEERNSK